ncbi:class I SAM-dependent methyltransferase [Halovivax sp.]|uniref:class I SAM-dependent methyltransferase n=1 Tax=Halovivax sp. TaxID=1935978 RepID=UPI0025C1017C|nr:class I SAM-dependent methyltransferase [Halovivax sp.]
MTDVGENADGSVSEPDDADGVDQRRVVREGYEAIAEAYAVERDLGPEEGAVLETLAADLDSGSRVLDAGCGDGRAVAARLVERVGAVCGLDVARAQCALARENVPAGAFVQGDLVRLPYADDAFDAVCSLHAIIHVPRDRHEAVFREFRRVLSPGGLLLTTSGVGPWAGRNEDWLGAGAEMRWSFHGAERTRELLAAAGFAVEDERVIDDAVGGGEWLYVLARAP